MADDFFEIDFLKVDASSSGDAIALRVVKNDIQTISIVDGGFTDTGTKIIEHIDQFFDRPSHIDHVILTHPDGDHAAGLKAVLEGCTVGCLWMNRPWLYAEQLIDHYPTYNSVERLKSRLKSLYPNIRDLEEIAEAKGIPIEEAFQGTIIGHFSVMSPTINHFLELVLRDDDKADNPEMSISESLEKSWFVESLRSLGALIASVWGDENLPIKETSPRNEMSIVQFANLMGKKILLTGDAGHEALSEFVDCAPAFGIALPGIDKFQVPHHGSRRNVSSDILNSILGPVKGLEGNYTDFTAVACASADDTHHPKKSVERAINHRGGFFATTEFACISVGEGAPDREGWSPVKRRDYPTEQEQ